MRLNKLNIVMMWAGVVFLGIMFAFMLGVAWLGLYAFPGVEITFKAYEIALGIMDTMFKTIGACIVFAMGWNNRYKKECEEG